jgi:hypothetical protein
MLKFGDTQKSRGKAPNPIPELATLRRILATGAHFICLRVFIPPKYNPRLTPSEIRSKALAPKRRIRMLLTLEFVSDWNISRQIISKPYVCESIY